MSYLGRVLALPLIVPDTAFVAALPLSCTLHASQRPALLAAPRKEAPEQHLAECPSLPGQGVPRRVPRPRGQGKERWVHRACPQRPAPTSLSPATRPHCRSSSVMSFPSVRYGIPAQKPHRADRPAIPSLRVGGRQGKYAPACH